MSRMHAASKETESRDGMLANDELATMSGGTSLSQWEE